MFREGVDIIFSTVPYLHIMLSLERDKTTKLLSKQEGGRWPNENNRRFFMKFVNYDRLSPKFLKYYLFGKNQTDTNLGQ